MSGEQQRSRGANAAGEPDKASRETLRLAQGDHPWPGGHKR
jgi:hypothetical protein